MLDLLSAGQYYTSDYLKDTGLINSGSFGKLYALIRENHKTAQTAGVINNGTADTSTVYRVQSVNQ